MLLLLNSTIICVGSLNSQSTNNYFLLNSNSSKYLLSSIYSQIHNNLLTEFCDFSPSPQLEILIRSVMIMFTVPFRIPSWVWKNHFLGTVRSSSPVSANNSSSCDSNYRRLPVHYLIFGGGESQCAVC